MLKDAYFTIYKPLTKLFNLFIRRICLPNTWKQANVIPVFKNQDSVDELTTNVPTVFL